MKARSLLIVLIAIVLGLSLGCGSRLPPSVAPIPHPSGLVVGIDTADITPPLHLSLFGHGPESRIAVGARTRLLCKPFVFARDNEVFALVPCDLTYPSLILQREISKRLVHNGYPFPADRIFLMATHTHAGPAHYADARRYSNAMSSSAPGFDEQVVEFLADRISGAVARAYSSLAPACLGWNQMLVHGLTINRSLVAFTANKNDGSAEDAIIEDVRVRQRSGGRSAAEEAIDPLLSVLRVDAKVNGACPTAGEVAPMGVFAVFGMHNTAVPNTNTLYHGDVFGFAVRSAEDELKREGCAPPRVGLANGIEGDVSPAARSQGMGEARRLGRALADKIVEAVKDTQTSPDAELKHMYWEIAFAGGQVNDGLPEKSDHLCPRAELGMASAGGTPDGATRLRVIAQANIGYRLPQPFGCHGYKLPLSAGPPTDYDFPRTAPIGVIRIGNGVVATAPGEMTTMTGRRIRGTIRGVLARHVPALATAPIAMVGLTNQYMQYFATAEEYDLQSYEGASTLYGRQTLPFLQRQFRCLTNALVEQPDECAGPRFNEAQHVDFSPDPYVNRFSDDDTSEIVDVNHLTVTAAENEEEAAWQVFLPQLPLGFTRDRKLKISVQDEAGHVLADDLGSSIEVVEVGDRWRVRWLPEDACAARNKVLHFNVRGNLTTKSDPFRVDSAKMIGNCDPKKTVAQ